MICCDVEVVDVKCYDYNYKYNPIENRKGTRKYNEYFHTFDIETTYHKDIGQSHMYVWQYYDGNVVIIGRTWNQFIKFIRKINKRNKGYKQVIYVHYLSHEFQYLSGIYNFKTEDIFCVKPRKVLKCEMLENIEFRCSYLLTNMSLDEYTTKMKVKNKKLTGEYNYSKIRTSRTPLDEKTEYPYIVNDVVGLHQAITEEMRITKDNIISISLTSTGFVRRDVRKVLYKYKNGLIKKITPTWNIYKLLREEFGGGDTHASRFYAGTIVEHMESMDMSSSYPYIINNLKFPMTRFKNLGEISEKDLKKYEGKAQLYRITFEKLELKDELEGCPCIMYSHTRGTIGEILDNGRILKADVTSMTITDIDMLTINEQYKWERCVITDFHIADYGYLPKELIEVVNKYYIDKTTLKGIEEEETYYIKSKNLLNAIYGMMASAPFRIPIIYDGKTFEYDENAIEEELYHEQEDKQFIAYQWGCWTTSHARRRLHEGINMVGTGFVYCDTDSVKYIKGSIDKEKIDTFNNECVLNCERTCSYAKDKKGIIHYMGVYEMETPIKRFITYGAKKYAYETYDGKLKITIAGVGKESGSEHLKEHGGLDSLKLGYVFDGKSGGKEVGYNDVNYGWHTMSTGERIYITKNITITPSTYTLSMTHEYKILTDYSKQIFKKIKEIIA